MKVLIQGTLFLLRFLVEPTHCPVKQLLVIVLMLMMFQPICITAFYFSSCSVSKSRFNLHRFYANDDNDRFKQLKEQLLIPHDAKASFPMYRNVLKPLVNRDDELKFTWKDMMKCMMPEPNI
jgi:hypothetical protein